MKEDDLDRLIEFDQALADEVGRLDEAIGGLEQAVQANEGIKEALKAIGDLLTGLNETFGRRADVIKNATE